MNLSVFDDYLEKRLSLQESNEFEALLAADATVHSAFAEHKQTIANMKVVFLKERIEALSQSYANEHRKLYEAYAKGKLSAAERMAFEKRLEEDNLFRHQFALFEGQPVGKRLVYVFDDDADQVEEIIEMILLQCGDEFELQGSSDFDHLNQAYQTGKIHCIIMDSDLSGIELPRQITNGKDLILYLEKSHNKKIPVVHTSNYPEIVLNSVSTVIRKNSFYTEPKRYINVAAE